MYIADKYWNNYIGDTDDSLTLIEYLADKQKDIISLEEIFSDTGLDKLNGDFRQHEEPLTIAFSHEDADVEDPYAEIYCAIDLITYGRTDHRPCRPAFRMQDKRPCQSVRTGRIRP